MNNKLNLQSHNCKGAFNCKTWLSPDGKNFYLIFSNDESRGIPETCTWIEYCPYCGFRPPDLININNQNKFLLDQQTNF